MAPLFFLPSSSPLVDPLDVVVVSDEDPELVLVVVAGLGVVVVVVAAGCVSSLADSSPSDFAVVGWVDSEAGAEVATISLLGFIVVSAGA